MPIVAILAVLVLIAGAALYFSHGTIMASNPTTSITSVSPTTTVQQTSNFSVNIAHSSSVGSYLANKTGWTLYIYANDVQGSYISACYDQCAVTSPPFYATSLSIPSGLDRSSFIPFKRSDGTMQLSYNGYPLYYYTYDTAPGDMKGQNVGHVWYVIAPSGVYTTT